MKIIDLLSRFSIAKKHTGELQFSFSWLLEKEQDFDATINPDLDVLQGVVFK